MAKIALSVEIAAPANLVGALFIPQRMPYWYGQEMDCRFEVQRGASEFQPGLKVKIIGQLAKREVSLVAVVTEDKRGRLEMPLDNASVRFVEARDGRPEGLSGIDVAVADRKRLLEAAAKRGRKTGDDEVSICGTRFYLV